MGNTNSGPKPNQSKQEKVQFASTGVDLIDGTMYNAIESKTKNLIALLKIAADPGQPVQEMLRYLEQSLGNKLDPESLAKVKEIVAETDRLFDINMDDPEVQKKIKTREGLTEVLGMRINNKFLEQRKQYMQDKYIAQFPELQKEIDGTLTKFVNTTSKYRFYMYKYMQLNAFIPSYTLAVSDVQATMFNGMLALLWYQREKFQEILRKMVQTISAVLDSENLEAAEKLQKTLEDAKLTANNDIIAVFQKVLERSKQIESASSEDLVQWLLNESETMRQQVDTILKKQGTPTGSTNS